MASASSLGGIVVYRRTLVSASTTTSATRRSRYKGREISSGRSCSRVSLDGCSSRRIDAPVLAMREREVDITSVQELADGSIFFSFAGSPPIQSMKKTSQPCAEHHIAVDAPLPPHSMSVHQPYRLSQNFQKRSPIPASAVHKKGRAGHRLEEAAIVTSMQETLHEAAGTTVKSDRPTRLPSAFSKRSPIPSMTEQSPFPLSEIVPEVSPAPPLSKDHGASTNAHCYRVDPTKDSPLSPALQEIVGTGLEFLMHEDVNSDKELKTHTRSLTDGEERGQKVKVSVSVEHFGTHISSANASVTHDLSSYKLPELRSLAKSRGLKGYSKLKKRELLDLLNAPES